MRANAKGRPREILQSFDIYPAQLITRPRKMRADAGECWMYDLVKAISCLNVHWLAKLTCQNRDFVRIMCGSSPA